ncbi:MAG: hypothetical protein MUE39_06955, partial [Gammaproteobacteria bacterium]|nr:hypothetical protein [Gammaproteobacteria bacterium]
MCRPLGREVGSRIPPCLLELHPCRCNERPRLLDGLRLLGLQLRGLRPGGLSLCRQLGERLRRALLGRGELPRAGVALRLERACAVGVLPGFLLRRGERLLDRRRVGGQGVAGAAQGLELCGRRLVIPPLRRESCLEVSDARLRLFDDLRLLGLQLRGLRLGGLGLCRQLGERL